MSAGKIILLVIAIAISLSMAIACMTVAFQDGDNPCQGQDKTKISLKTWNIVNASVDFWTVAVTVLLLILGSMIDDEACPLIFIAVNIAIVSLFKFVWMIIGIVILARSHGECIANGEDIGNVTVAALVFMFMGLSLPLCSSGQR